MDMSRVDLQTVFVYAFLANCLYSILFHSVLRVVIVSDLLHIVPAIILAVCCMVAYVRWKCYEKACYLFATLMLAWVLIGMVRGLFAVEGYWGFKNWTLSALSAMSFVMIFFLRKPLASLKVLQHWNFYFFPVFIFFGSWAARGSYPLELTLIYFFYALLIPIVRSDKKVLIMIAIGLIATFTDTGYRSGIIKALMSLLLTSSLLFHGVIRKIGLNIAHWALYLLPMLFVYLGLTGTFNFFSALEYEKPKEVTMSRDEINQNQIVPRGEGDTRTFIYKEVINSAITLDYVEYGHTIGRGHTHEGGWAVDEEGYDNSERLMDEAGMLNIFTWLGVVGVILYTLLFLQASCLGLYCSHNRYVPVIATVVAFHWAFSWIEECTEFTPMDLSLFLLLGICMSPEFRKMTDDEFRLWFKSCFTPPKELSPYHLSQLLKLRLVGRKIEKYTPTTTIP